MYSSDVLLYSGTVTANGDSKSLAIDTFSFKEANFYLKVTAKSGTSPTLNVSVIVYDPHTNDWYTLVSFTQKSDVGTELKTCSLVGKKIAISWTVGGTSPSFTFKVSAHLKGW
jgi:hypothetical protein